MISRFETHINLKETELTQIDSIWACRDRPDSGVLKYQNGKGHDIDWMTIVFDGMPARTFERQIGRKEWIEVPFLAGKR